MVDVRSPTARFAAGRGRIGVGPFTCPTPPGRMRVRAGRPVERAFGYGGRPEAVLRRGGWGQPRPPRPPREARAAGSEVLHRKPKRERDRRPGGPRFTPSCSWWRRDPARNAPHSLSGAILDLRRSVPPPFCPREPLWRAGARKRYPQGRGPPGGVSAASRTRRVVGPAVDAGVNAKVVPPPPGGLCRRHQRPGLPSTAPRCRRVLPGAPSVMPRVGFLGA